MVSSHEKLGVNSGCLKIQGPLRGCIILWHVTCFLFSKSPDKLRTAILSLVLSAAPFGGRFSRSSANISPCGLHAFCLEVYLHQSSSSISSIPRRHMSKACQPYFSNFVCKLLNLSLPSKVLISKPSTKAMHVILWYQQQMELQNNHLLSCPGPLWMLEEDLINLNKKRIHIGDKQMDEHSPVDSGWFEAARNSGGFKQIHPQQHPM